MDAARWRVVGVSEMGASHRKSAALCQDANAFLRLDEDWLAIAVADGAGSAAKSELGAATAVNAAVTLLAESFYGYQLRAGSASAPFDPIAMQEMLVSVLAKSRATVEARAQECGIASSQLASTLIAILLGPDRIAAAQVGDGGAVIELADGRFETLLKPDSGEFVNETTFLTSARAMKSIQFAALETPVKSIAVITDGLQMLALRFPEWIPFQPFFAPVFAFVRDQSDENTAYEEVRRMLQSDQVSSRTPDDVTLLVAARVSP